MSLVCSQAVSTGWRMGRRALWSGGTKGTCAPVDLQTNRPKHVWIMDTCEPIIHDQF